MDSERWQEVERIYHLAKDIEPGECETVLKEECKGDESLRGEVESLLGFRHRAKDFIESPALEVQAKALAQAQGAEPCLDLVGHILLHYQITGRIGEGGMGVVYCAHDTHLNRPVAIKVLPKFLE
jgi:eukaryotic-like serine/threonine-protein kinase